MAEHRTIQAVAVPAASRDAGADGEAGWNGSAMLVVDASLFAAIVVAFAMGWASRPRRATLPIQLPTPEPILAAQDEADADRAALTGTLAHH